MQDDGYQPSEKGGLGRRKSRSAGRIPKKGSPRKRRLKGSVHLFKGAGGTGDLRGGGSNCQGSEKKGGGGGKEGRNAPGNRNHESRSERKGESRGERGDIAISYKSSDLRRKERVV